MFVFDFVLFYTTFGLNINQCHYNYLPIDGWVFVYIPVIGIHINFLFLNA